MEAPRFHSEYEDLGVVRIEWAGLVGELGSALGVRCFKGKRK